METVAITITKTVRHAGSTNASSQTVVANCAPHEIPGTTNRLLATMVEAAELLGTEPRRKSP